MGETCSPLRLRPDHLLTINCFFSPETQPPRLPSPVPSRLRRRAMPPASALVSTLSCSSAVPLPTSPTNTFRPSSSSRQARLRKTLSWSGAGGARGSWARGAAVSFVPILCDMLSLVVSVLHIPALLFRVAFAGRQNPFSAFFTPQPSPQGFIPGPILSETLWDQLINMRRIDVQTYPNHAFLLVTMVVEQVLVL